VVKSCEQNLKMLAKDAILPLRYVPRFVGIRQLSNWDRPEDVTEVATPLSCMSCSHVGICQLSNWEHSYIQKMSLKLLVCLCGYSVTICVGLS
jgi:hypothetical protein